MADDPLKLPGSGAPRPPLLPSDQVTAHDLKAPAAQVTTAHPAPLIIALPSPPPSRLHSPAPEAASAPASAPTPAPTEEQARAAEVAAAASTWRKTSSRVARADGATDSKAIAEVFRRTTSRLAARATADLRAADLRGADGELRRVGRYELREALGTGGCGTVFKAWDPRHERFVALKLVHRADDHARARFEREIKTTARLSHPSIVPLLDSGEQDGALFLVMELVDGASLDARVEAGTISPRDAVAVVRDAAVAVHHAHGAGVLHRDLKPHNILVDASGRGRVTDFGLALVDGVDQRLTAAGSIVGTPAYMPPEQISAHVLDARCDVYSLGASLFHALAKQPPFETESIEELFLAILRVDATTPCRLDPTIPADLGTICLKALEKDRERRYPTAQAFADELQRWLDGEPIIARPPTQLELALRWSRHNPLVVAFALTTMLLAAALLAVLVRDAMK